MRPPGELDELDAAGRTAWTGLVTQEVDSIVAQLRELGRAPTGLLGDGEAAEGVRTIEWPGFPVRVSDERGLDAALELLDRPPGSPDGGRMRQEEYLEWWPIRRDGRLRGIEMTTELGAYWEILAEHGEEDAPAPPEENGEPPFMIHENNTLHALLALVLSAARPLTVVDKLTGQRRYPSGSEAIAALGASAADGRNSDPLIVERIVRFVSEGRHVAFDDPLGVYIGQVQLHELAQPDGEDVPAAWLALSRGAGAAESPDGRSRCQRLKLTLPDDADFNLDELTVRRSGERLRSGGQLAALVELAVYVQTGPVVEEPL